MRLTCLSAFLLFTVLPSPEALADEQRSLGPLERAILDTLAAVTIGPDGRPLCFPAVEGPANVHIVSSYVGGKQIQDSPLDLVPRAVRVEIASKDPVYLVLAGHEDIAWQLSVGDHVNLVGIFMTGHLPQLLVGAPAGTSVGSYAKAHGGWRSNLGCELPSEPFLHGERWKQYLELNSFGAIQTDAEINDLMALLKEVGDFELGSHQFIHSAARITFTIND